MYETFPSCTDYIARYGCDSYLDDDLIQVTSFKDDDYRLTLATDCNDFIEVKMFINDNKIIDIHEEGIEAIRLHDERISIFFRNSLGLFDGKSLEVIISPLFSVKLVTMLSLK